MASLRTCICRTRDRRPGRARRRDVWRFSKTVSGLRGIATGPVGLDLILFDSVPGCVVVRPFLPQQGIPSPIQHHPGAVHKARRLVPRLRSSHTVRKPWRCRRTLQPSISVASHQACAILPCALGVMFQKPPRSDTAKRLSPNDEKIASERSKKN